MVGGDSTRGVIWLLLWGTGLAACALLGRLVRFPFPWVFLIVGALAAGSWRALPSLTARRLALSLATTALALAALEGLLLTVLADRELDRGTDYDRLMTDDDELGRVLRPGTWIGTSWLGWQELYEASYTVGPDGWRTTGPPAEQATASILCFGGSFTFGQGLEDGETWPWRLAAELGGEVEVVNLGVPGWGPSQMLALAESPELEDAASAPPRLAVHLAIPGHPQRVSGDEPWSVGFPRYELSGEGEVTRRGNFGERYTPPERSAAERLLRTTLRRSALLRRIRGTPAPREETPLADQIELWAAVVERSAEVLRERHPGLSFLVLFWDHSAPGDPRWERQEAMLAALEERELEVVRLSTWLADLAGDPRWRIPHDHHPSAAAAAAIAEELAARWRSASADAR